VKRDELPRFVCETVAPFRRFEIRRDELDDLAVERFAQMLRAGYLVESVTRIVPSRVEPASTPN
jgi:hypothetical protein